MKIDNIENGHEDEYDHKDHSKTAGNGSTDRRYYFWAVVLAAVGMAILVLNMTSDYVDVEPKPTVRSDNNHRRLAPAPVPFEETLKK